MQIGQGGMGEVWSARHRPTGAPVAVKLLAGRWSQADDIKASFRDEVRAVAALDHPHIIRVIDYGEVSEAEAAGTPLIAQMPYLVMEVAVGGTLRSAARDLRWPQVEEYAHHVLSALAHAHARGVTHRDLKGGNILLAARGAVLTDFGIAHIAARGARRRRTVGAVSSGTPSTMAPEQFQGDWRLFGPGTDVYALGALLWWLVTGQRPFPTKTWMQAARAHSLEPLPLLEPAYEVPAGLESWLRRCMAKDPRDRFLFAADAAEGLRRVGLGRPLSSTPAPMPVDWVDAAPPPSDPAVALAGLGLFGLRALPFVDRDQARDCLWRGLAAVRDDACARAVIVRGSAGTGKSRLARWFVERAHELGLAVPLLAVHGPTMAAADGLGPMVARHLRLTPDLPFDTLLQEELVGLGAESSWEWELLARLVDPAVDDPRPSELYAALRNLLCRVAHERPVILWLDDAQWGRRSLALAQHLLASAGDVPVLMVLTVRDEALASRPSERAALELLTSNDSRVDTLVLEPLAEGDSAQLIREMLHCSASLTAELVRRSSGNPLFAVQLLHDWVQQGHLQHGPSGYELRPGAATTLPSSLSALWGQRVDQLIAAFGGEARTALQVAALLGLDVVASEWHRALRHAGIAAPSGLVEALISRRLASPHPTMAAVGWSFSHGLLRDAILETADDRAPLHLSCAAGIQGTLGTNGVRKATHLHLGNAHAEALPVLQEVLEESMTQNRWGEVTSLSRMFDASLLALTVPIDDPRWGVSLRFDAAVAIVQGNRDIGERKAEELLTKAEAFGWVELQAHACILLGQRLTMLWRNEEAIRYFQRARDLTNDLDTPRVRASALRGIALCGLSLSSLDDTIHAAQAAFEVYQGAGDSAGMGSILHIRAIGYVQHRRWAEAISDFELAVPFYKGAPLGTCALYGSWGNAALRSGDLDGAQALYDKALTLAQQLQSDIELPIRLGRANLWLRQGRHAEALLAMEELRKKVLAIGAPGREARLDAYLSVAQAKNRRWLAFDACLDRVHATDARPSGDTAEGMYDAAICAWELGERERGSRAMRLAIEQWRRLGAEQLADEAEAELARAEA